MAVMRAAGLSFSRACFTASALGLLTSPRDRIWRLRFSGASASGSTSVSRPIPERAHISAKAPPILPQPTTATCFFASCSASLGLRANIGSIISQSFQSRLFDETVICFNDLKFHWCSREPLTSEVEGVDVNGMLLALHDPRDELLGV